jgi:hypothetical protein
MDIFHITSSARPISPRRNKSSPVIGECLTTSDVETSTTSGCIKLYVVIEYDVAFNQCQMLENLYTDSEPLCFGLSVMIVVQSSTIWQMKAVLSKEKGSQPREVGSP